MPQAEVVVAMRYAEPSFKKVLLDLKNKNVDQLVVAPMYPQEAESTTTSSLVQIKKVLFEIKYSPKIKILNPFYSDQSFIEAWDFVYKKTMKDQAVDHVLFSYHGLPERHLRKKSSTCLLTQDCCSKPEACSKGCYKAQCLKTTDLIAKKMNLKPGQYTTSFQSRVGVTKLS